MEQYSFKATLMNQKELNETEMLGDYKYQNNQVYESLPDFIDDYCYFTANKISQPPTNKIEEDVQSKTKIFLDADQNKFSNNKGLKEVKINKNNEMVQSKINPHNGYDSDNDKIDIKKSLNIMGNKKKFPKSKVNGFLEITNPTCFSTLVNQKANKKYGDEELEIQNVLKLQIRRKRYGYNLFISIILNSLLSILMAINQRAKLKYEFKLKDYYIKRLYGISINKLKKILESKIYDVYTGKFFENDPKEKQKNIDIIESLLKMEKKDKKTKINLLSLILNTNIEEIAQNYLHNYPYIKYGEAQLYITGFKTFKNEYNEFNIEIKEEIKNNFNNFISFCKICNPEDNCEGNNNQKIESPESNNINIDEQIPYRKNFKKLLKGEIKEKKTSKAKKKILNKKRKRSDE